MKPFLIIYLLGAGTAVALTIYEQVKEIIKEGDSVDGTASRGTASMGTASRGQRRWDSVEGTASMGQRRGDSVDGTASRGQRRWDSVDANQILYACMGAISWFGVAFLLLYYFYNKNHNDGYEA